MNTLMKYAGEQYIPRSWYIVLLWSSDADLFWRDIRQKGGAPAAVKLGVHKLYDDTMPADLPIFPVMQDTRQPCVCSTEKEDGPVLTGSSGCLSE